MELYHYQLKDSSGVVLDEAFAATLTDALKILGSDIKIESQFQGAAFVKSKGRHFIIQRNRVQVTFDEAHKLFCDFCRTARKLSKATKIELSVSGIDEPLGELEKILLR